MFYFLANKLKSIKANKLKLIKAISYFKLEIRIYLYKNKIREQFKNTLKYLSCQLRCQQRGLDYITYQQNKCNGNL